MLGDLNGVKPKDGDVGELMWLLLSLTVVF